MSLRRLLPVPALLALGVTLPGSVAAQGSITVALNPATVTFPAPGVAHFDAEGIDHGGMVVSVTSRPGNRPWELRIRAADAEMGLGKPISDLSWSHATSGPWAPLSTADAMVVQGTGDQDVTVYFRLRLDWASDGPGAYSAALDFTVIRL